MSTPTRRDSAALNYTASRDATPDGNTGSVRTQVQQVADVVNQEAVDTTLTRLLWWSAAGLGVMVCVCMLVGSLLAVSCGRCIRSQPGHGPSLLPRLPIELDFVARFTSCVRWPDTIDSLLDRLERAFDHERRLVATMSHELRTPLANQQIARDVALSDPAGGNRRCPFLRGCRLLRRPLGNTLSPMSWEPFLIRASGTPVTGVRSVTVPVTSNAARPSCAIRAGHHVPGPWASGSG